MKHLPIGGSTIARTIQCPAWLNKSKNIQRGNASQVANLGNLLHDAMENYYKQDRCFNGQILDGLSYAGIQLTTEHLPILNQMVHATEAVLDLYDIEEMLCEPFVEYIPERAGGSIDMLGLSADLRTALILDYKTGVGVVRADQNKQLMFYTLAAMMDPRTTKRFDHVEKFVAAIVQPRVYGDQADLFEFDRDDLERFKHQVDQAIIATDQDTPTKAGDACTFCPNEPYCNARIDQAAHALLLSPENQAALAEAVPLALQLKKWCDTVLDAAVTHAESGIPISGYKLVRERSNRKWSDATEAEALLLRNGFDAFSHKLITPNQAMKLTNGFDVADNLADLIEVPEGKLVIAPDSDPREPVATETMNEKLNKLFDKKLNKN